MPQIKDFLYQVRWKGFSDLTWEPHSNIAHLGAILDRFNEAIDSATKSHFSTTKADVPRKLEAAIDQVKDEDITLLEPWQLGFIQEIPSSEPALAEDVSSLQVASQEPTTVKAPKQAKKRAKKATDDQENIDGEVKKPAKRQYNRKSKQEAIAVQPEVVEQVLIK